MLEIWSEAEDRWEVRTDKLVLHEVIGEGAFGVVRKATLDPHSTHVAVKMLKGNALQSCHLDISPNTTTEYLHEVLDFAILATHSLRQPLWNERKVYQASYIIKL